MADKWDEEDNVPDNWEDEEKPTKSVVKDNWDDEEEEVKDSWDQEESEKPKPKPKAAAGKTSGKSNVPVKEMTEEEKREAQLKADLNHTNELFGVAGSLDSISLKSKEDYTEYINRFFARVNVLNDSPLYPDFLEDLFKAMCKDLSTDAMRKISNSMRTIYDNKMAEEKLKSKDSKTKKSKGKIKLEHNQVKGDFDLFLKDKTGYDQDGGDDDFM